MSEDNRNKLVWKYFWEQKREEVGKFLEKAFAVYLIFGWALAAFFLIFTVENTLVTDGLIYTGNWWGFIPGVLWLLCAVYFTYIVIDSWIASNWKQANKRADRKLESMDDNIKRRKSTTVSEVEVEK